MADVVDTTNVESVPEVPAEVVSKETITDPEAADVATIGADAEKSEVPAVATEEKAEVENGSAETAPIDFPKENGNGRPKEEEVSQNGKGTNGDDTEERKRKQDAVEAVLEESEVSAEKKAKLEEKSEVKQDEVENSPNGEAEVAA